MEPSKKSPEITSFLEEVFGRSTAIQSNDCVACGEIAEEFNDELSRKEYTISGLCQDCQDYVFGGAE